MQETKQPDLNSWNDFAGDYLKAEYVEVPNVMVVVGVEAEVEDGRNKLIADIEYKGRNWKFDLNKTNQNFVRSRGCTSPKALIGKKMSVEKIKVRNPTTNAMVDSLIITKVE